MKKIFIIVTMCSLLALAACANESHASEESTFDEFMKAYIAQDYEVASTFVTGDTLESFTKLQTLISDKDINTIALRQMSDVKYKVLSSEIIDDKATLKVRIIYRNAGGAFMNAISTMYVQASEGKLSANSSDEISLHIRELLFNHLDTELETMDRERTVELIKVNEQWQVELNEEFTNALSANILNAIEELKIMGVQF